MAPWTIGHDEPFDEPEPCENCEDEECAGCSGDDDEDINDILEREHDAAQRYHENYPPHGWSPE